MQNALSLDPLSILFRVHLGFLYYVQRKYEHSIAQFRKVLEMNPQYYLAHAMMAPVYTQTGQFRRSAGVLCEGAPGRRQQQVCGFAGGHDAGRGGAARQG